MCVAAAALAAAVVLWTIAAVVVALFSIAMLCAAGAVMVTTRCIFAGGVTADSTIGWAAHTPVVAERRNDNVVNFIFAWDVYYMGHRSTMESVKEQKNRRRKSKSLTRCEKDWNGWMIGKMSKRRSESVGSGCLYSTSQEHRNTIGFQDTSAETLLSRGYSPETVVR